MNTDDPTPWIVWIIVLPFAAATLAFLSGGRIGRMLSQAAAPAIGLMVVAIIAQVMSVGPIRYPIGGWGAPLGIDLYADGLSALMLLMTATVGLAITIYAGGYFSAEAEHASAQEWFWPLWMFTWGALNALFLSADMFNLYITMELLTLASIALIGLAGQVVALIAALRYLIVALAGSLFYLLGVALLYSAHGTLDLELLAGRMEATSVTAWGVALMTLGLMLKTALFPMHFWLPPAHANAPAPVSALLSALVVKGSFYLLLRLWFPVFTEVLTPEAGQLLGGLGGAAVFWGGIHALRQRRLKLLVAYSTVSQIGYLFLVFALAQSPAGASAAWNGAVYFAFSHALAKAALFLAAGALMHAAGHDDLEKLESVGQRLPISLFAFGLGGVSLMGLPPSGGFIGKWLLLTAAIESGQWWYVPVLLIGGLLAAAYVFRVVRSVFSHAPVDVLTETEARLVPPTLAWTSFGLALAAVVFGLAATPVLALLQIGAPFAPLPVTGDMP